MRALVTGLPVVRLLLHAMPVLYACRTAVTALWSAPSGPWPLNQPAVFSGMYWAATAAYLVWALVIHRHLRLSVYLGVTLGVFCMYRSITIAEARFTFGSVAYSAVVNWATFSLATLLTMTLSAQYILLIYGREDDDA